MTNEFIQTAWVVADLDASIERWRKSMKTGPFYVFRNPRVEAFHYRGRPGTLNFSVGIAQAGPMQVELIQQHDAQDSAYRDVFKPGESGFHHVCGFVPDYDAELARYAAAGAEVSHSGVSGAMRFSYVDTRASIGCMTEVLEENTAIREMFAMIAASAEGWDGTDPVRYF